MKREFEFLALVALAALLVGAPSTLSAADAGQLPLLVAAQANVSVNPSATPESLKASDSTYSVTVLATREVPSAKNPNTGVFETTLQVAAKAGAAPPKTLIFGGSQEYVREQLRELKLTDGQLIAATECSFAVFDLKSGHKKIHVYSSCNISISADGKRVAYVEDQFHFTPPQASSSIVRVLDVVPLATYTVFPDPSKVYPLSSGLLVTWIDDLSQVHGAGKMYWSPEGKRLLFFCVHGDLGTRDLSKEGRPYLVVVDLRDLAHSRLVHQPIARDTYMIPGAEPKDRRSLFQAKGIEWLPGGTAIRVVPMPDATWMKRDIVLKVPAPP